MPMSETYYQSPRAISTYSRSIYGELVRISDNIDFNKSVFMNRQKRNRSIGSAQALIVELALTDEYFLNKIRSFMINNGKQWFPTINYTDRYY